MSAAVTPIYLLRGHGSEYLIPFEERSVVKPGYTIVTISKCGIGIPSVLGSEIFTDLFTDPTNYNLLRDPETYKWNIEKLMSNIGKRYSDRRAHYPEINIYTEGDKIPELKIQMFLDYQNNPDKGSITFRKSGVYPFPQDKRTMTFPTDSESRSTSLVVNELYSNSSVKDDQYFNPSHLKVLESVFEGSIFPTVKQVSDFIKSKKIFTGEFLGEGVYLNDFSSAFTYKLSDILDALGPGVYYYFSCRSPEGIIEPHEIAPFLEIAPETIPKNWYSIADKVKRDLLERLDTNRNTRPLKPETIREIIAGYNTLSGKVGRIRASSIIQQHRRTARRRRSSSNTRKRPSNSAIKNTKNTKNTKIVENFLYSTL